MSDVRASVGRRSRLIGGSVLAASALSLGACGGGGSPHSSSTTMANGPCHGGSYCVSVAASGALQGPLVTTTPPGNFRAICTTTLAPTTHAKQWVSHTYGTLSGKVWTLVVQTTTYAGPSKSYAGYVTLSQNSTSGTAPVYFGPGTVTVGSAQDSATIDAKLELVHGAASKVNLRGSTSCSQFSPTS